MPEAASEVLLDELIDHPGILLRSADPALTYPDHEARWQVAHALGQLNESPVECETILRLLATTDEADSGAGSGEQHLPAMFACKDPQ